ncbi:MAG: hypothetical protein ABJK37_08745 [Paraglaciecola sp.]|uniref:hypothetical protein n=1 Tax=Paraglaciecola sp. TaxID=1920173 RepID=UPI003296A44A
MYQTIKLCLEDLISTINSLPYEEEISLFIEENTLINEYKNKLVATFQSISDGFNKDETLSSEELNSLYSNIAEVDLLATLFGHEIVLKENLTSHLIGFNKVKKWFENKVVPKVKSVLSTLWKYLCTMLTPSKWKINGKIKTPLIGFTETGIEIEFG